MNQYIRRRHKERKEAATRASREQLINEQMDREDTWNSARREYEASPKAMRDKTIKVRKEAARKREEYLNTEKRKKRN